MLKICRETEPINVLTNCDFPLSPRGFSGFREKSVKHDGYQ